MTSEAKPARAAKLAAAVAGVALCAVAGFLVWRNVGDDTGSTDGPDGTEASVTTVALPEPEPSAVSATVEYLDGEGAAILVVHEQAGIITTAGEAALTPERCAEAVATLDAEAPADEIVGLIGEVPEEVLSAAFESERVALGTALTACTTADDVEPLSARIESLEAATAVVDQRLDELEVTR